MLDRGESVQRYRYLTEDWACRWGQSFYGSMLVLCRHWSQRPMKPRKSVWLMLYTSKGLCWGSWVFRGFSLCESGFSLKIFPFQVEFTRLILRRDVQQGVYGHHIGDG